MKTRIGRPICKYSSLDKLKAIVAVFARVSLASIASRQNDIYHLSHRDEVQPVFGSVSRSLYQLLTKVSDTRPKHCRFISGFHPVAMKLDKQPIGPPSDADCRLLP